MSKVWYGSIYNRLEENKMFCKEIEVGTGMTEYYYSDTHPYEVTKVIDQKHVMVRAYDHKHIGEPMTNNWELIRNPENPELLIVKRGDYWYWENTVTVEQYEANCEDIDFRLYLAQGGFDPEVIKQKGKQVRRTRANVSFGVARYHYDYEF